MKRFFIVIGIGLFALLNQELFGQDGYPVPRENLQFLIEDRSTVDLETIQEIKDGGFTVFYHGTWKDYHLFHYNWYSDDTSMNPWFRVFRCPTSKAQIQEDLLIHLESEIFEPDEISRGSSALGISLLLRRSVISVDTESESLGLGPNFLEKNSEIHMSTEGPQNK